MMIESNERFAALRSKYISNSVGAVSMKCIDTGLGALLRDVEGRTYIDFAGGIGAMNVGHSHPHVVAAIKAQTEKLTHCCFMVNPYAVALKLAEKLCGIVPGGSEKKAIFLNSGSEAVENAVKIARYYTKRPAIVVFENAYHGRTLLTMTMTSKIKPYKLGFGPFAPEIYRMPFDSGARPEAIHDFFIKHVNPEAVAAVVAEPIQGEGGFITPPQGYFQELVKICHDNGILFVVDEIQSGMGRTGKMFAIEHWNVEPDLIVVGKSLAAGMPLSAVVGKAEVMDSVHPWGLGGTYSGNPVACAAALAVLELFESEHLLEKSVALGNKLNACFKDLSKRFEMVQEIRGIGAMLGLSLTKGNNKTPATQEVAELVTYCHDNGLIILSCGTYGNVIRTLIPFVITDAQLEEGLAILENGLADICG